MIKNKEIMTKQTFQIPEGCKAITMEQVGNEIITTFELKFKRGDVLISKKNNDIICVFNDFKDVDSFTEIVGLAPGGRITFFNGNCFGSVLHYRHATPEEAQRLWDALAKEGKQWNPETMQVEPIKKERWRAERGERYYYISLSLRTLNGYDAHHGICDIMHEKGNYFQTEEQAQRAANRLQSELNKFWEEELR